MSKIGIPALQVGGDGISATVAATTANVALPTMPVSGTGLVNPKWVAVSFHLVVGLTDENVFVKLGVAGVTVSAVDGIQLPRDGSPLILNAAGHGFIAHIKTSTGGVTVVSLHVVPLANQ